MDSLGLYDIYEYAYLPWWQTHVFKISVAVALFICFDIAVYFLVRRIKRRTENRWEMWDVTITRLRSTKMNDVTFYHVLSALIKDCSVRMLNAPEGATDAEVALFLKSDTFAEPIRVMGAILEKGSFYKYDPAFKDTASESHEKELVYIHEALTVIKQMVTKQ